MCILKFTHKLGPLNLIKKSGAVTLLDLRTFFFEDLVEKSSIEEYRLDVSTTMMCFKSSVFQGKCAVDEAHELLDTIR